MRPQDEVASVLQEAGPLTGAQLQERTRIEILKLWSLCRRDAAVRFERFGRRFLRLDRTVEGYARLSPSIRREFQTYTVLGLDDQAEQIRSTAEALRRKTLDISRRKLELARDSM
ncbi:MAG: hypothetical protein JXB04_10410, partial [Kiritimatiellae bacterium]|nr:hypothetical protein [Kiritimatiellia bacterium]